MVLHNMDYSKLTIQPRYAAQREENMKHRIRCALLLTALAVSTSACGNENDNANNNDNDNVNNICITCVPGGSPTGTSSVNKITINMPSTVCLDQKISGEVVIDPVTTSALGSFLQSDRFIIGAGNVVVNNRLIFELYGVKVGKDSLVYMHNATNKRQSAQLEVKDCSSGGGGNTSTVDSVVITPRGAQTFLVGTFEFYNAPTYRGGVLVKDVPITWSVSSGSCASLSEQNVNSSGVHQTKVSANFAGTATLTATAGGKTASVPLTCRGVEGSYNGIWLEMAPLGWNTSPGTSRQFTAVVHGAPAGSNFKPYFYCSRFDIVSCVGQDTTFTNDARFGTGPQKGGTAKVVGIGSFNACFRLGATDYRAWICVPVVSGSAIMAIGLGIDFGALPAPSRPWYPKEGESSPPPGLWQ